MELQDTAASRIHIGFPLGLALLFASLLFICGFFCCCLHWKRLQSLFRSYGFINPQPRIQADLPSYDQKLAFPVVMVKQEHAQSLPVLMPGDEIPKFIAMACPRQPPKDERITIHMQHGNPKFHCDYCSGN